MVDLSVTAWQIAVSCSGISGSVARRMEVISVVADLNTLLLLITVFVIVMRT